MPASVVNNHRIIGGLFSFIQSWRPPVCNRFLERELCFCIRNANGGMHIAHVSSSNELVMLQWTCMCPMGTGGRRLLRNNFNQPNWCCCFVRLRTGQISIRIKFCIAAIKPINQIQRNYFVCLRIHEYLRFGSIIIEHHVRRRKKNLNCGTMRQLVCIVDANRIQHYTFPCRQMLAKLNVESAVGAIGNLFGPNWFSMCCACTSVATITACINFDDEWCWIRVASKIETN